MAVVKRRGRYVIDYRDEWGRRVRRSFRTRKEAEKAWARATVEKGGRLSVEDPDVSLAAYGDAWLKQLAPEVRERTLESYQWALGHVPDWLGQKPLRAITKADARRLKGSKASLSASSWRIIRVTLHGLFADAEEDGYVLRNPFRSGRRRGSRGLRSGDHEQVKALTRPQLERLIATAALKEPRFHPLVLTLARTGLRVGEALGLRWEDLDLDRRVAEVRRQVQRGTATSHLKTSSSRRTVDLSRELVAVLKNLDLGSRAKALRKGTQRPDWLFPSASGGPLDKDNVGKRMKRLLREAELPLHHSPHSLRHTYASQLIAAGISPAYVQRQLGHASIRLTVDLYGAWLPVSQPSFVDTLDSPREATGHKWSQETGAAEDDLPEVVELVGGPRRDRTGDLLIAKKRQGLSGTAPDGLSPPEHTKEPEDETG